MSHPPKHDVTNLVELEENREPLRRRLRIWHLLFPTTGDDLRAYRSLLKFAKPYRGKILLSIFLSFVSALFMGVQLGLMNGALDKIFAGASEPVVASGPKDATKDTSPAGTAQSPDTDQNAAAAPVEGEHTFVRSVKNWWEE